MLEVGEVGQVMGSTEGVKAWLLLRLTERG